MQPQMHCVAFTKLYYYEPGSSRETSFHRMTLSCLCTGWGGFGCFFEPPCYINHIALLSPDDHALHHVSHSSMFSTMLLLHRSIRKMLKLSANLNISDCQMPMISRVGQQLFQIFGRLQVDLLRLYSIYLLRMQPQMHCVAFSKLYYYEPGSSRETKFPPHDLVMPLYHFSLTAVPSGGGLGGNLWGSHCQHRDAL